MKLINKLLLVFLCAIVVGYLLYQLLRPTNVVGDKQREEKIVKEQMMLLRASQAFDNAISLVDNNNANGLKKLLEIALDDDNYPVDYNETASEYLHYYLYTKTELWIRTFSKHDLDIVKTFLDNTGIFTGVRELPPDTEDNVVFQSMLINRLKDMKVNVKEMELVNHILALIKRDRQLIENK